MRVLLDGLERHGKLVEGKAHYSPRVRAELLPDGRHLAATPTQAPGS